MGPGLVVIQPFSSPKTWHTLPVRKSNRSLCRVPKESRFNLAIAPPNATAMMQKLATIGEEDDIIDNGRTEFGTHYCYSIPRHGNSSDNNDNDNKNINNNEDEEDLIEHPQHGDAVA